MLLLILTAAVLVVTASTPAAATVMTSASMSASAQPLQTEYSSVCKTELYSVCKTKDKSPVGARCSQSTQNSSFMMNELPILLQLQYYLTTDYL